MEPKIKVTVEIEHVVLETDLKDPMNNIALIFLLKMCEDSTTKEIARKVEELRTEHQAMVKEKESPT